MGTVSGEHLYSAGEALATEAHAMVASSTDFFNISDIVNCLKKNVKFLDQDQLTNIVVLKQSNLVLFP